MKTLAIVRKLKKRNSKTLKEYVSYVYNDDYHLYDDKDQTCSKLSCQLKMTLQK